MFHVFCVHNGKTNPVYFLCFDLVRGWFTGWFCGPDALLDFVEVSEDRIWGFLQVGLHSLYRETRPSHVGIVTDDFFKCSQWGEASSGMEVLDECGHGPNGIGITCSMLVLCAGAGGPLCRYGEQIQVTRRVHDTSEDMVALHRGHIHLVTAEVNLAPCLA